MLNKGWIKLHRKITEWEWYDDLPTFKLFIHLLITVSIEEDNWHGIRVPRGSRVTSISKLAEETKLSIRQTRTALEHLIMTQEVTKYSTARYTLISVVNYDSYQTDRQSDRQKERQTTDTLSDKQPTNNRQTTDNSIRIQEYKNVRREEIQPSWTRAKNFAEP